MLGPGISAVTVHVSCWLLHKSCLQQRHTQLILRTRAAASCIPLSGHLRPAAPPGLVVGQADLNLISSLVGRRAQPGTSRAGAGVCVFAPVGLGLSVLQFSAAVRGPLSGPGCTLFLRGVFILEGGSPVYIAACCCYACMGAGSLAGSAPCSAARVCPPAQHSRTQGTEDWHNQAVG